MQTFVSPPTLAPDAAIDLQLHTTYSDGNWSARELLDYVAAEGVDLVAVTDHDRADTAAEVRCLADERRVHLLPAVEMSSEWEEKPMDLLCYGFDPERNALEPLAEATRREQLENLHGGRPRCGAPALLPTGARSCP